MTAAAEASPIDAAAPIQDEKTAISALRWTAVVMAVTPLFLLVFNAASLKSWADGLAPSDATQTLRAYADRWEETTERWGVAAPRDAVHAAWKKAVALRWDGTSGGE